MKELPHFQRLKGRSGEGGILFDSLPFLMGVGDFWTCRAGCVSVVCPGNDAELSKSVKDGLGSFGKIGRKAPWVLLIRPASRALRSNFLPHGMHSIALPPRNEAPARRTW